MTVSIITLELNYKDTSDDSKEVIDIKRIDINEINVPIWAKTLFQAVEIVCHMLKVKPENLVIRAFETAEEEKQYLESLPKT